MLFPCAENIKFYHFGRCVCVCSECVSKYIHFFCSVHSVVGWFVRSFGIHAGFIIMDTYMKRSRFRANKVWILCLGFLYFLSHCSCLCFSFFHGTPMYSAVRLFFSLLFCFFFYYQLRFSSVPYCCDSVQNMFEGKIERCFIICIKCLWCIKTIGTFFALFLFFLYFATASLFRLHLIRNVFLRYYSLCLCVHFFFSLLEIISLVWKHYICKSNRTI